uniref:Uncharacterized protein n=1 Tax=Siphoviridae sp. ctDOT22 TaxID=2827812 RepID=A0A8S5SVM4_9CAUD|nr:MAG TPA: hypothetical protein [Siphoviridae sp. ctDOT22]
MVPLNASNEIFPIHVRTTSYFYLHDKILSWSNHFKLSFLKDNSQDEYL